MIDISPASSRLMANSPICGVPRAVIDCKGLLFNGDLPCHEEGDEAFTCRTPVITKDRRQIATRSLERQAHKVTAAQGCLDR